MGQLDGKVAIVTGGGSGIGKGIAKAFADEGCSVVIAARNADRLDAAAAELSSAGATVIAIPTDVTSEDQVISLFAKTMDQFGKLDVLVNNSGAFDGGPVEELTMEQWQKVIDVNVTGPFLGSREAFKIMKKQGGGSMVNISSIAGIKAFPGVGIYGASKAALQELSQVMAMEAAPDNIRVNCILPALVEDTELCE